MGYGSGGFECKDVELGGVVKFVALERYDAGLREVLVIGEKV